MPEVVDAEVLVSFRFGTVVDEAQSFYWLRGSGDWADLYNLIPSSGYGVQIKNTSSQVKVFLATGGGGRVVIGSARIGEVGTGMQWLRFRVEGDQILVKVWSEGSAEPSNWELVVQDSSVAGEGVYQTGFSRSGGSSQRDIYFDHLTVTDLGEAGPVDRAPTVDWVEPAADAVVAGEVTLRVSAVDDFDPLGSLDVDWRVDGGSWSDLSFDPGSGWYQGTWDSSTVGDGQVTLEVRAVDSSGGSSSASRSVTVDNINDPAAPVLADEWGLGNGSAWSPGLWSVSTLGSTVVDVVGGQGHIGFSGTTRAGAAVGRMPEVVDAEVLVSFRFGTVVDEAQSFYWLRGSGDWADLYNLIPSSGYGVQIKNTSSQVKVFLATGGGGRVVIGSARIGEVGTGMQWLRFRVEGDQILVKVWSEGSAEPSNWELVVQDSSVAGEGVYQTGFSRSGGSSQRDIYFDHLTVTDLVPG
jgi:hypothetical protein